MWWRAGLPGPSPATRTDSTFNPAHPADPSSGRSGRPRRGGSRPPCRSAPSRCCPRTTGSSASRPPEDGSGIGTLTLDYPEKLNTWCWEATRQLGVLADQVRFDDRIRVLVVKAEGRAFCAGIDLGMPEDRVTGRSPAEKVRNYYEGIRWVHERFRVFAELPQPIVCRRPGVLPRLRLRARPHVRHPRGRRRRRLRPARGPGGRVHRRRRRPPAGPRGRGGLGQAAGPHRPAHRRGRRPSASASSSR